MSCRLEAGWRPAFREACGVAPSTAIDVPGIRVVAGGAEAGRDGEACHFGREWGFGQAWSCHFGRKSVLGRCEACHFGRNLAVVGGDEAAGPGGLRTVDVDHDHAHATALGWGQLFAEP